MMNRGFPCNGKSVEIAAEVNPANPSRFLTIACPSWICFGMSPLYFDGNGVTRIVTKWSG